MTTSAFAVLPANALLYAARVIDALASAIVIARFVNA